MNLCVCLWTKQQEYLYLHFLSILLHHVLNFDLTKCCIFILNSSIRYMDISASRVIPICVLHDIKNVSCDERLNLVLDLIVFSGLCACVLPSSAFLASEPSQTICVKLCPCVLYTWICSGVFIHLVHVRSCFDIQENMILSQDKKNENQVKELLA